MITHCIVDEGASVSIFSARAWQGMGSPNLVSTAVSYWNLIEELV